MDARVGRFEGMDPADGHDRQPSSLHRYVYAMNQSPLATDPTGEDSDFVGEPTIVWAQVRHANLPKGYVYHDLQQAVDEALSAAWFMANPGGQLFDPARSAGARSNTELLTEAGGYVYAASGPFGVSGYYFEVHPSIYADAVDLSYDKANVQSVCAIVHTHPNSGIVAGVQFLSNEFSRADAETLAIIGLAQGTSFGVDPLVSVIRISANKGDDLIWAWPFSQPFPPALPPSH
jgi:hypothetical protein